LFNKRHHPVVQISLEDAMAFAAWTGKRIPTEDEWEAAARSSQGFLFPWGNGWKESCCNIEVTGCGGTVPVDAFGKNGNEYGVCDLMGNVLEWTGTSADPGSQARAGSGKMIAKGGSWTSEKGICLPDRFMLEPDMRSNILGFRCVAL
jgi:formylglycine-generating enzyme required for sulfatase activity